MRALEDRSRKSAEPVAHIVMSSLARTLQIDHSTLFQVSTSTALVDGIYDGVVTIAELRRHGDFGLGTFADLDGEMLALEGQFFQVRGTGTVTQPDDGTMAPFSNVDGTLVGFWTPLFARMINTPGWHLHFVDASRTGGGHVLDCRATGVHVAFQELSDLRISMPESASFLRANLSNDPTRDLALAENVHQTTQANRR